MAKKHRILLPVLALLLIGACSRNEEIEQPTSPSGGVEVAILCDNTKEPQVYSLPDGTRTWIDDNDWTSTRWDKNDKIALWATADGSNYTLNAQNFSLAYFTPSYSTAVFNSTVADMPAGTYTYTAVSPVPESVSVTPFGRKRLSPFCRDRVSVSHAAQAAPSSTSTEIKSSAESSILPESSTLSAEK